MKKLADVYGGEYWQYASANFFLQNLDLSISALKVHQWEDQLKMIEHTPNFEMLGWRIIYVLHCM